MEHARAEFVEGLEGCSEVVHEIFRVSGVGIKQSLECLFPPHAPDFGPIVTHAQSDEEADTHEGPAGEGPFRFVGTAEEDGRRHQRVEAQQQEPRPDGLEDKALQLPARDVEPILDEHLDQRDHNNDDLREVERVEPHRVRELADPIVALDVDHVDEQRHTEERGAVARVVFRSEQHSE